MRVYAGVDPLTGKRHDLTDLADTASEAEVVRTRLLNQLDERRNPRTKATVNQLLDRYLQVVDVEPTTKKRYEGIIERHLRPTLGKLRLSQLDGDVLDSLYAQLRQCRERCGGSVRLTWAQANRGSCLREVPRMLDRHHVVGWIVRLPLADRFAGYTAERRPGP